MKGIKNKSKNLNLGLILASLTGYLEWGGGNRVFLFQVETEVLPKLFTDFSSAVHPLDSAGSCQAVDVSHHLVSKITRQNADASWSGGSWQSVGSHARSWDNHLKSENDSLHPSHSFWSAG